MDLRLTDKQARILGALIEKELSTPDYYPMTVNALRTACNQKTNRDPVVDYSEIEVVEALDELQRKRLVGTSSSAYGRAAKYRHAVAEMMELSRPELAILASLLLRGPETPGEIRSRAGRMHAFDSLEEVDGVLRGLMERAPALVAQLPRRPGQKETRYAQLLTGEPVHVHDDSRDAGGSGDRILQLEERVELLQQQVDELIDAFESFRREFQ